MPDTNMIQLTVDVHQKRTISPLIYGSNEKLDSVKRFPAYRLGGNRMTGYNWENNMSNAGHDFHHVNDDYMVRHLSEEIKKQRGSLLTTFHNMAREHNAYDVITLPMAGFVSADGNGEVTQEETAPSPRWKKLLWEKPDVLRAAEQHDRYVYLDECLKFLVNSEGTAATGGIRAYMLDNEPALWPETHPRIHPAKPDYPEIITRSVQLARIIKRIDPTAEVYGLAAYGFGEMLHFQRAPGYEGYNRNGYTWFLDYYLDQMRRESEKEGVRLLDVLDLHWYPEAKGAVRIIEPGSNDPLTVHARVQATRTLWQEGFRENSWISRDHAEFLPLIPRVQAAIDKFYPGTKISFSEINFGGGDHMSGAIAAADYLGVLGKYGIYAAFFWPLTEANNFIAAAYNLYLNYDGQGNGFGNNSIVADSRDIDNIAVYASIAGEDEKRLHVIAINKSDIDRLVELDIKSSTPYATVHIYAIEQGTARIILYNRETIAGNNMTISIAAYTVLHFIFYAS
jgi:mannan endo-1,4-beta-mannosidase